MGTVRHLFRGGAHRQRGRSGAALSGGAGQGDGIEGFVNYDRSGWHFSYPVEGAVARSIEHRRARAEGAGSNSRTCYYHDAASFAGASESGSGWAARINARRGVLDLPV